MLTIDDYKKVLSMLQKEQERKPQCSNNTKTEEKRIEEAKRLFELNTAKEALFELIENPEQETECDDK